ncbi:unnamed protein product [Caenorhabditis brenneri]
MTESRPLSYECWECVLPYFDFKTRQSLSERCPSLQKAFKSPIVIKNMEVTPMKIKIDNITYQVGIIQQYHGGKNPDTVEYKNSCGGFSHEVDKYGLNSAFDGMDARRFNFFEYEHWENERKKCEKLEEGLFKRMSMLRINRKIRELDEKYFPIQLKKNGEEPPFSQYIQFRILKYRTKQQYIERLEYSSKTLIKCMDYIFKKLFENRKGTIKNLTINWKMLDNFKKFSPILENFSIKKSTLIGQTNGSARTHVHRILQDPQLIPHIDMGRYEPYDPLYLSLVGVVKSTRAGVHLTYGDFDFGAANLAMASICGLEDAVVMEMEELKGTRFPNLVVIQKQNYAEVRIHMVEDHQSKKYILHIDKMENEQ